MKVLALVLAFWAFSMLVLGWALALVTAVDTGHYIIAGLLGALAVVPFSVFLGWMFSEALDA